MKATARAILRGGSMVMVAFFLSSTLLMGNALADAKKGVPTKLVPKPKPEPTVEVPQAPPPVALTPPPKRCVPVPRSVSTYSPGHTVFLSGLSVNVCGCCGPTQLWSPAIFASTSGTETVTTSFVEVCD